MAVAHGWQPYHHPVPFSRNLGSLFSWNPLGLSRPVMGLLYLNFTFTFTYWKIFFLIFKWSIPVVFCVLNICIVRINEKFLPYCQRQNIKKTPNVHKLINDLFISVINQIDEQNFCFTIRLFHASTCFKHHVLIIRSKLHYTASGITTPTGGRLVHTLREETCARDGHL